MHIFIYWGKSILLTNFLHFSDNQGILADEPGTVSKTSDKVNNHGEMR